MKKGLFAQYHNKFYYVSKISNDIIRLVSQCERDIKDGFKEKVYPEYYQNRNELPKIYIKEIRKEDVEKLYEIDYKAQYRGHTVNISSSEKEGDVNLGTGDAELAKELGFERTDKYYYEKWVSKDEVQIIEEKKEISL
ncbi:hypothetical protein [Bacillus manliponensis]|uniref:hypothetical protein n=1 Tax=Bacillus manliponensis TaxID=574376 RepID=UPI00351520C6